MNKKRGKKKKGQLKVTAPVSAAENVLTQHNKKFFDIVGVVLLVSLASFLFLSPVSKLFTSPELLVPFVQGFGQWAWGVFFFLQFFQVVVSVIPGQALTFIGGYLFGFWIGFLLSLFSTMAGSVFVFYLSKKFGKPLVLSFVSPKEIAHLSAFFERRGFMALVIARTIPFFPNDAISFVAGLTDISYIDYSVATFIGFIPYMLLLTLFGTRLSEGIFDTLSFLLLLLVSVAALIYFFRKRIRLLFLKELRSVEEEFRRMEEELLAAR